MFKRISISLAFLLCLLQLSMTVFAATTTVPTPSPCFSSTFSKSGNAYWYTISLQLTNTCSQSVDLQNSTITFNNSSALNTSFWGNFGSISYPSNTLAITSQAATGGGYLATLALQFPTGSWVNTLLPKGQSITLIYGNPTADYNTKSVNVYLNGSPTPPPATTGTIVLTNATAASAGITANVNVELGSQVISSVQIPSGGQQSVAGLNPGTYTVLPQNVTNSSGIAYQGTANPTSVAVVANSSVSSTITYTPITQVGSINLQVSAIPSQLGSYTQTPSVTLTNATTGSTVTQTVPWNQTTTISQLSNGITYNLSTPSISNNGYNCTGTFTPSAVISNATTPPTASLAYSCTAIPQVPVSLNVSGLANGASSVVITFTPNNGSAPVNQTVNLTNGSGTASVNLTSGAIYTLSTPAISGYAASFSLQPLTVAANATENVTFTAISPASGARIAGYLLGWETPPAATALAAAGYTHVLVAFGVFSTTSPGQIANAFSTITPAYIAQLHAAGIKVLLSVGGASTSLANTTVSFDQVLTAASSPAAFQSAFITSLESYVTQYGFDGVDFDIEEGLNPAGTFTNPTGDIAALASIINQLHASYPNLLITLVPQSPQISATSGFNDTFGNYSSLIMQTASSLTWVAPQLYNSGCNYGINEVCYDPNTTTSPDFAVAMAVDLLANWPSTAPNGQATGFQPYVSTLTPSQVMLGVLSINSAGAADGAPVIPPATLQRAIQCMRTGVQSTTSCDTYVPPTTYPTFGSVFDWNIYYDQSNNYQFATSLVACIFQGKCT